MITERRHQTMALIADFFDGCRYGYEGVEGYRKSTDLFNLSRGIQELESLGLLSSRHTVFADLGCADGRVNILMSYFVKLSLGTEIDSAILAEYGLRKAELDFRLQQASLELPPGKSGPLPRELARRRRNLYGNPRATRRFLCRYRPFSTPISPSMMCSPQRVGMRRLKSQPDLLDGDDVGVGLEGGEGFRRGFVIESHNGDRPVPLGGTGEVHVGDIDLKGAEGRADEADGSRFIEVVNEQVGPFQFGFQRIVVQADKPHLFSGKDRPGSRRLAGPSLHSDRNQARIAFGFR